MSGSGRESNPAVLPSSVTSVADSLAYSSRMMYLQDGDKTEPDPLFRNRNQAQRMQHSPLVLSGVINTAATETSVDQNNGGNQARLHRKALAKGMVMNKGTTWEYREQAGCRFFQNALTGECSTTAPPGINYQAQTLLLSPAARKRVLEGYAVQEEEEKDDSTEFPDAFKFLDEKDTSSTASTKISLIGNIVG